jgi:hypothetical protein
MRALNAHTAICARISSRRGGHAPAMIACGSSAGNRDHRGRIA